MSEHERVLIESDPTKSDCTVTIEKFGIRDCLTFPIATLINAVKSPKQTQSTIGKLCLSGSEYLPQGLPPNGLNESIVPRIGDPFINITVEYTDNVGHGRIVITKNEPYIFPSKESEIFVKLDF